MKWWTKGAPEPMRPPRLTGRVRDEAAFERTLRLQHNDPWFPAQGYDIVEWERMIARRIKSLEDRVARVEQA